MTVNNMKEIVVRMGIILDFSPRQPMRMTLILATTKRVLAVVIELMMMLKTKQTRAITMKSNLTPLDLKILFYIIVMMS